MKVNREDLINILKISAAGLTVREILEQSNHFVFVGGQLITFNGEVLTKVKSPLDVEGAIPSVQFLSLLEKFPDDEVGVTLQKEQFIIKGKRRSAGITRAAEIHLPYEDVPSPKKWKKTPDSLMGVLYQAAQTCGRDETQPMTTAVHVTPDRVEGCDNFRCFRHTMKTGFKTNVMIPAIPLYMLDYTRKFSLSTVAHSWTLTRSTGRTPPEQHHIQEYSLTGGWVHFKTGSGHILSIRTLEGVEYPDLTSLIKMKDPEEIALPKGMIEVLGRAKVIHTSEGYEAIVQITVDEGKLTLTTSKDGGWYKETKRVNYHGPSLQFEVHPTIFEDLLQKQRHVWYEPGKMKIETGDSVFVISLEVGEHE